MHWINFILILWIILLGIHSNQVCSSGLFELRLKYFNNDQGRDNEGKCCSGQLDKTFSRCTGSCNTRFRVCLKHYQAKIDTTSQCTFGDVVTPVLGGNSVNLTNTISNYNSDRFNNSNYQGFTNPILFPFNFAWPGTFTLILEAWHDTNSSNSRSSGILISRSSIQRVLDISTEWTEDKFQSSHTWLAYDFRVTCDVNYYGNGCAELCRPRNDQFGHYTCSEAGKRVCLSGWQGDYCSKPRCAQGCNEVHGHCNKPNECLCQPGWKGQLCDECEPYPGCVHGSCKRPWECICNEGWGGLFCNQDLNYCTNHRPCQNNGTCRNTGQGVYTCECPPGFTGNDCETNVSSCEDHPCLNNSTCIDDLQKDSFRCECAQGWSDTHCETKLMTCNDKPCIHGTCRDTGTYKFHCECPSGYSGTNCEHSRIDDCASNPCLNGGSCESASNVASESFKCLCPSGYTGDRCEKNIDDCQGNPCLNGGKCIDMVNQFRCHCVPGFVGSLCADKVDLCLTQPCANGGRCKNLNNDYECTCRAGFTGKDCSIDIDECSSGPCHNGGTCVNRVNSFTCVCPNGFMGSQCDEEIHTATFDAHQFGSAARNDGLTNGQVILIAILSVAMPVIAVIAACVVICMKRKRKRDQEKDDAEARKQNEQNATAHHGITITSKRNSSSGLVFDSTNPNIIKNTWNKSVNNISASASVDDCFSHSSLYGAMSNYSDTNGNNDFRSSSNAAMVNSNSFQHHQQQQQLLQRTKSQKQLNTDPSLIQHRVSQTLSGINNNSNNNGTVNSGCSKEYLLENKISILGEPQFCSQRRSNGNPTNSTQIQTRSQVVVCNPHI